MRRFGEPSQRRNAIIDKKDVPMPGVGHYFMISRAEGVELYLGTVAAFLGESALLD